MKTLVPDYYSKFKCKCGACRHCCCNGWGITLSYLEYCKLLGLDCSKELRRKLDCAFYVLNDSSSERYAMVKMNFMGNCPLQDADGLCSLQCELGEKALPLICKMYPRNIGFGHYGEGACANSCEKVVEMLWEEKDGLNFEELEHPDGVFGSLNTNDKEIQLKAIEILKDRKNTLATRHIKLGKLLGVDKNDFTKSSNEDVFFYLIKIIKDIEEYSPTFERFSILAENDLQIVSDNYDESFVANRYKTAKAEFDKNFPDSDILFENVMINHLFFERFPTLLAGETVLDKYIELCGMYAIMRFICVAYTETRHTKEDLVDCIAGLFRCFEHSDASKVIMHTLKHLGKMSYGFIVDMISKL